MKKGSHHSLKTRQKIGETLKGRFSGKKSPSWKGGRMYSDEGYVLLLKPDHPHADSRGYVLEHILILENKLGRPFLSGETSHHINGKRDDNRAENLTTFASNSEHVIFHHRMRARE